MNNSKFTTAEVREILPKLLSEEKGVTINTCGYDSFLCELILMDPITIDSVDEYDGILDIHFSQRFDGDPGFDNLDAWEWKYQTIQEVEIFKSYRGGRIG